MSWTDSSEASLPANEPLPPQRRKAKPQLPRRVRYPELSEAKILQWADDHYAREGRWPTSGSGFIPEAPRDKWENIDSALSKGLRGLQPGSSLARLLAQHRGVRNRKALPPYTERELLRWADAHRARTGEWPGKEKGAIPEAPGETWMAVDGALSRGLRGLPGGSSLNRLLAQHRGIRNKGDLPRYTEAGILEWADAHRERTGQWPTVHAGPIGDAPGESWSAVDQALTKGVRGLPGGSSLARLLAVERGAPYRLDRSPLNVKQILKWADAHCMRTGTWVE